MINKLAELLVEMEYGPMRTLERLPPDIRLLYLEDARTIMQFMRENDVIKDGCDD